MPQLPPILKSKIIEAQQNTKSNMAAARYLGIPYDRYRQYAMLYGLFESHNNQKGVGIAKGFATLPNAVKLKDIFEGKHPNYSMTRLKRRLIRRGLLVESCVVCGFSERRLTDGKIPLILTFKDGKRGNMALDNLHLLCYNCMFLTTGLPQMVNRRQLDKAMRNPHLDQFPQDWLDNDEADTVIRPEPDEPDLGSGTLTATTIDDIHNAIQAELDQQE